MASGDGEMGRREVLADAAIEVLARDGMRGLTHRAVETEAGLPPGSTSNRFRTRHDLVMGVVERLADRDLADLHDLARAIGGGRPASATAIADLLAHWSTGDPARLHARLTLTVEGLRDPRIRAALDAGRAQFVALADEVRTAARAGGQGDPFGDIGSEQLVAFHAAAQWAQETHGVDITGIPSNRA